MVRRLAALSVAVVLALGVAACSDDDDASPGTTTTVDATTTSTGGTTSSSGAPSSTSSTEAGTPRCGAGDLTGELNGPDSGAGQVYFTLVLRNTGSRTCETKGFPGVSLLDASGTQIGEPATREGAEGGTVTVAPGGATSAVLHTTNEGLGPPCEPASSTVKVFPPDQTEAVELAGTITACGGVTVTSLVAGDTGVG